MSYGNKVLIIDDEEAFCYLVKKNLEATGEYQVFVANNGEDGIILAKLENPDVILLDIMMPQMHGGDVAEALKDNPKTVQIPIIFLTAIIRKEEIGVEPMRGIGGNKYIAKPVETRDLVKCLKEVILESQQKRKKTKD